MNRGIEQLKHPDPPWARPTETTLSDELKVVYVDFLPNIPKTPQSELEMADHLRTQFEMRLPSAVERFWDLKALILEQPDGEYLKLLIEARELFVAGYFYSCVAMCGIAGERIIKDLLRRVVLVSVQDNPTRPSEEAFDQLERVDVSALVRFLNKIELLTDDTKGASEGLLSLRNAYAHARGKDPQADALKAINQLHTLVEGTVSLTKNFELVDGRFVPKASRQ